MLTHRGIVLGGKNYNMLEGVGDSNNPIDLTEIIYTLGTWPDFYLASTETYEQKYAKLLNAFDKVNWLLVNTIGYDLIYKLYTNNERQLVFNDDNGNPVITLTFDDIPKMCYATYNLAPGGSYMSIGNGSYNEYDYSYPVGIKFRMLANSSGNAFTVTATRHSDNHTETFTVYPKKYFIDDFHLTSSETSYADVYLHGFCTDKATENSDRQLMPNFKYALTNPVSLYHEIYTIISTGVVTDKLYILMGTSRITSVALPDIDQFDAIQYDNGHPAMGWDSSNINFEDYIVPEVGFMNEINERYSPRGSSNIVGIYVFDESKMHDVAKGLIKFGFYEFASQIFGGGDFKDAVMYINFFHGLHDQIAANIDGTSDIKAADNFLRTSSDLTAVISSDSVDTEFVEWKTPIAMRVTPHFNDYRDYLCAYQLYLPYYGFVDINPNDAVNADLRVYYNINICTRAAVIIVTSTSSRTSNLETKIFSTTTTVGEEVPYGKNAIQNHALAMSQLVGKAFVTGASLGTSMQGAHLASGANLRGLQSELSEAQSKAAAGGNDIAMYENKAKSIQEEINNKQNSNLVNSTRLNNARMLIGGIPTPAVNAPTRSNGGNSETGTMEELYPYLLITRPVSAEPSDYEDYVGSPSTASVTLGQCNGFTQVAAVKPQSMTDAPKYVNEIIALLQAGVYL